MNQNQTVISIATTTLVLALVGVGTAFGAYVTYRVHTAVRKNANKDN